MDTKPITEIQVKHFLDTYDFDHIDTNMFKALEIMEYKRRTEAMISNNNRLIQQIEETSKIFNRILDKL